MQNFKSQTYTEKTALAAPPVSLETGRLEWRQMLILEGAGAVAVLLGLVFAQAGAALFRAYSEYEGLSARWLLGSSAWLVAFLLIVVGLYMMVLPLSRERQHAQRVKEYSDQHLEERRRISGIVTERSYSQYEYRANRVDHILVLAMWAYRTGNFRVQDFRDPIFIGGRRIADGLAENDARMVPRILAEIGIIDGRARGHRGQLTVDNADELLDRIWRYAGKISEAEPALLDGE